MVKQRTEMYKKGDPKFLVAGNLLIAIPSDEVLADSEYRLIPPLTQADIDEWIARNPEKAKKVLDDAREALEYSVGRLCSVSYAVSEVTDDTE